MKTKNKKLPKGTPNVGYSPSALAVPIVKTYDILIGDNVKVIEDKKSKTRVAHFPFEFPDGTRGIMIVCRVKDENWKPSDSISKLLIDFK